MEIASRQQRRNGVRLRKRAYVCFIDLFQVVAARCSKMNAQLCRATAGQLFRVEPRRKAVLLACFQNLLGLADGERAAIAENIAEFSELFRSDSGDQFVGQKRDVLRGAVQLITKLARNDVGAEKC